MSKTSTEWQQAGDAARRYRDILVPSILGPAAEVLVAQMEIRPGERVLDVGCGTGAAMRFAARSAGRGGAVHGLDADEAMLECARETLAGAPAPVELHGGDALALPFADETYDVVLCAQALQFLPDYRDAAVEMRRVLVRGGRVGVSTWAALEGSPYFHSVVRATEERLGPGAARGLEESFSLDSADELGEVLASAGFEEVEVDDIRFELMIPEPAVFLPRHVSATPMAAAFAEAPPEARQAVVDAVTEELEAYLAYGSLRIPFRTLVGRGRKAAGA